MTNCDWEKVTIMSKLQLEDEIDKIIEALEE